VLFLFSSTALSHALVRWGLPSIPLIPVSSSQAVVGAVIGIGLLQGGRGVRQIRWGVLARIASGWVTTPLCAALIGFLLLFVVQNVFNQQVFRPVSFQLTPAVLEHLQERGVAAAALRPQSQPLPTAVAFRRQLRLQVLLPADQEATVLEAAEIRPLRVEAASLRRLDRQRLSPSQREALRRLEGRSFRHGWQLRQALERESSAWAPGGAPPGQRDGQFAAVERVFRLPPPP
jgi:PiT family inorganic phosphate transporter